MASASLSFRFDEDTTDDNSARLQQIMARVEKLADQDEWSPGLTNKIQLIVEELSLNAMTYGRHNGLTQLEVAIFANTDLVSLQLRDDGSVFDPTADAPVPDPDALIEDRPVGGLGIFLVKQMADSLGYVRKDGWNHLTVTIKSG